jgi:hypothetical protein
MKFWMPHVSSGFMLFYMGYLWWWGLLDNLRKVNDAQTGLSLTLCAPFCIGPGIINRGRVFLGRGILEYILHGVSFHHSLIYQKPTKSSGSQNYKE